MDLAAARRQTLAERGEPRFRARQVWAWAARGASGYEEMTDLPAALRETLARELPFSSLALRERGARARRHRQGAVRDRRRPPAGGGADALPRRAPLDLRLLAVGLPADVHVLRDRRDEFARNLTRSEILDQALHFRRIEPVDHCVFMGMGEPMLNLDTVLAACERLPDIGITHRRTDDLDGRLDPRDRTARRAATMPLRLALSLHAADEALRSRADAGQRALPAARRDRGLPRLLRAQAPARVRRVRDARRRQRPLRAGARARARCWRPARASEPPIFKVNLIPYNPTGSPLRGLQPRVDRRLPRALEAHGVAATVRLTRGRDIDAACGQLAAGDAAAGWRRHGRPTTRYAAGAAAGARLAGAQQPLAQLGLLLGRRVPAARRRAARRACAGRTASGTAWSCGRGPRRTASGRPPRSGRARAAWRRPSRR